MNIFSQPWFAWAVGLAVGLPLLLLVLGEVVVRLQQRNSPLVEPLHNLRTYLLPAAALALLLQNVAGFDRDTLGVRLATTLFWIVAIIFVLSLVNALVFDTAEEDSWRSKVPRIFLDLGRAVLIAFGVAIVLATVWGIDPSGLLTAIGLSSLVIGLTLQNSIGPVIAGLLLLFEQPFKLGDWLKIGDKTGRVVQINWRAVHLDTGNELQIVPNGSLAGATFSNFTRPTVTHDDSVSLKFTLQDPPNLVRAVLMRVTGEMTTILQNPAPRVLVGSVDGDTVTYVINYSVATYEQTAAARDDFLTRVWYVARREQLSLVGLAPYLKPNDAAITTGLQYAAPLLRADKTRLEQLATQTRFVQFARGETVLQQGMNASGLFVITSGRAQMIYRDGQAGELHIGELGRGDYFGETTVINTPSATTIIAVEDLSVIVVGRAELQMLLDQTPRLAQDLDELLEQRRRTLVEAREKARHPRIIPRELVDV